MKYKLKTNSIAALVLMTSTLTVQNIQAEEGLINIPTISANLVKNATSQGTATTSSQEIVEDYGESSLTQVRSGSKHPEQFPLKIAIKPGVNEIITVARNVGNRIVFPFDKPVVHTFNKSSVKQSGNVIYIATGQKNPIGVFVTDADDESVAISLTLVPRDIPPREVRLSYKGFETGSIPNLKKADRWEKQGDFESMVKNLLKNVALRESPPGFSLKKKFNRNDFKCEHKGVKSQLRQVITGSNLEVGIKMIENTSSVPIELYEPGCYSEGVVAVAGWPTSIIKPGEATELYIVRKILSQKREYGRQSNLKFDY